MAKAPTRKPVLERGVSLLALIAAASVGYLFLTQEEGADIVTAGQAALKTDVEAPAGLAAVELTDAGKAFLAEHQSEVVAPAAKASPSYEIEDGVAMPDNKTRSGGRQFQYPFDKLNVGQSFHVAKTADNEDPAARLASSVSGARARFAVPETDAEGKPVMETVKQTVYAKDDKGSFVKGADGKRVKTGEQDVSRPKMKVVRDFSVRAVDATDPKGEGARVWRTA